MRLAPTALLVAALACGIAVAPAMELDHLPDDTQWFLRLDAHAMLSTGELGRLAHDIAQRPDVAPKLAALTAITGFDPFKDLTAATVAGSGPGDQAAVLFLDGRFDRDRLTTLVKACEGYATSERAGLTIHRWRDNDKPGKPYVYACFLTDSLLAMGGGANAMDHAVDAYTGTARFTAPTSPAPAGLLVWGHAGDFAKLAADNAQAQMVKNVQEASLSLAELDGALVGDVTLIATDAATADQLRKLIGGFQALAQLNGQTNQDPVVQQLITSLKVSGGDKTVRLGATCPIALLRGIPALAIQASAVPEH